MGHIKQNLKSVYTCQDAIDLFKKAAQAYQISQFTQLWMEIQNRYPRVANYLTTNITFGQWSRAHFSGNRYNIMTTGCAESINNALREARAYPVIALLDAVQELTSSEVYFSTTYDSNTP